MPFEMWQVSSLEITFAIYTDKALLIKKITLRKSEEKRECPGNEQGKTWSGSTLHVGKALDPSQTPKSVHHAQQCGRTSLPAETIRAIQLQSCQTCCCSDQGLQLTLFGREAEPNSVSKLHHTNFLSAQILRLVKRMDLIYSKLNIKSNPHYLKPITWISTINSPLLGMNYV